MPEPPPLLALVSPEEALAGGSTRLVEVIDRLLDRGVVIRGDLWLTVAEVDLAYLGLEVVLASHDAVAKRP